MSARRILLLEPGSFSNRKLNDPTATVPSRIGRTWGTVKQNSRQFPKSVKLKKLTTSALILRFLAALEPFVEIRYRGLTKDLD